MGEVELVECMGNIAVSVTRVWLRDGGTSFHATSFYRFYAGKIAELDEYWAMTDRRGVAAGEGDRHAHTKNQGGKTICST